MVSVPLNIQKDGLPHSQKNHLQQSINRAILQQLGWQNLSLWEECSAQPERTQRCMAKSHTHTHIDTAAHLCVPTRQVYQQECGMLNAKGCPLWHCLQQRPGHDPATGLGEQILIHPYSRIRCCH